MLLGNEPMLAMEDLKEVMKEEPNSIPGFCIMARSMFMTADFEKSLSLWHKARKLRERSPEVNEAIDTICQTILSSLEGCFSSKDTWEIIEVNSFYFSHPSNLILIIAIFYQAMISKHGSVDSYLESIKGLKVYFKDFSLTDLFTYLEGNVI